MEEQHTENDVVAINIFMGGLLCKAEGSIILPGLIYLTKSLPGEEAFADKYNSAVDLSSNGDLKLQESMCM